jgi:hypothetical protein
MADPYQRHAPLTQLYVLRLWRESVGAPWQAMLRPAGGGPLLGFANLEQLASFLLRLADDPARPVVAELAPGDHDY